MDLLVRLSVLGPVLCIVIIFLPFPHPAFIVHVGPTRKLPVTVIIPNFNKGLYLYRSLGSACTQTLQNIEIIVADDGSSDNSVRIIGDFAAKDARISFFTNGVSLFTNSNRIKAVQRAHGDFILMLDSDDQLTNQTAEVDYNSAITAEADIIEHKALVVSNGVPRPFTIQIPPFKVADRKALMAGFTTGRMNWTLWRKLIRRLMYLAALEKMGDRGRLLRIRLCDDRLQCGMLYTVVNKFVFINFVGYLYYWPVSGSACSTVSVDHEGPVVDAILNKFYPSLHPCSYLGVARVVNWSVWLNGKL